MVKKIIAGLLLLFICGCGTTSSLVQFQYEEPNNPREVLIYIYRVKHFVGAAVSWPTRIDGRDVACLKQGAYFIFRTMPGEHLIETAGGMLSTPYAEKQSDVVNYAPGVYFIRFQGPNGRFLTKEQALPEISTMKYDSGMLN